MISRNNKFNENCIMSVLKKGLFYFFPKYLSSQGVIVKKKKANEPILLLAGISIGYLYVFPCEENNNQRGFTFKKTLQEEMVGLLTITFQFCSNGGGGRSNHRSFDSVSKCIFNCTTVDEGSLDQIFPHKGGRGNSFYIQKKSTSLPCQCSMHCIGHRPLRTRCRA